MEKIINEYGKFLLDALVVGLLIAFLFANVTDAEGNKGIIQIVGAHLTTWDTDYETYTDYGTYAVESDCLPPVISYTGVGTMQTGTNKLTDYINAKAWDGTELALDVLSVKRRSGVELAGCYNADAAEISFDRPGIYEIRVAATDAWNRKVVCDVQIPVSR